uniref:Ig-like domain-containing protein n=1 Tax=Glossina pallidipes TaxID=7398 RepID=A0A1A9ZDZ2_GLOPL
MTLAADVCVEWTPVPPQQDMVFTLSNGSLMFYPFSAEKYRHEVHATVYRCKLRNLVGTVLSREIHVRGVTCLCISITVGVPQQKILFHLHLFYTIVNISKELQKSVINALGRLDLLFIEDNGLGLFTQQTKKKI